MQSMSKKEKLARGSAVIKVMRVVPRPGHFLNSYLDYHKMPRIPPPPLPKGAPESLLEMPYLNVRTAEFLVDPRSARIPGIKPRPPPSVLKPITYGTKPKAPVDPCNPEPDGPTDEEIAEMEEANMDIPAVGLPDGHRLLRWFGYREWVKTVYPAYDGNLAEHFNNLLGLLITMSKDPNNENFPDCEAYPVVQFLRTIKTPEGNVPYNTASFISYLERTCWKMLEDADA